MSAKQRLESPQPTINTTFSNSSSRSQPPSPTSGSFTPSAFSFPLPSTSASTSSSISYLFDPLTTPTTDSASAPRFHDLYAATRSRQDSLPSPTSSASSGTFRFPPDMSGSLSDREFDSMQNSMIGLGLDQQDVRGFSARGGNPFGDVRFDEPEEIDSSSGREGRRQLGMEDDDASEDTDTGGPEGMNRGFGRPASMDMGGESETSFDFLLSPPPAFDPSSTINRQLAAVALETPKAKRERTFPAPLLLKGDRTFGGSSPVMGSGPTMRKVSTPQPLVSPPVSGYQPPARPWIQQSTDSPRAGSPSQPHRVQHSANSSTSQPSVASQSSSHTNSGSTSSVPQSEPPIAPQALLLYILSLRSASQPLALSQSQGAGSRFAPSNNPLHQRIRSAGSAGSDNEDAIAATQVGNSGRLDTVDLSHKRIAEVPVEIVRELRDEVEKLALGYNLLRDLPPFFTALGSKLRYLNVRVNMLTTFPQVLCEMPSLEILDISRNKIKRLPTNPGTLLNLKVFSIAKNRVKRLPTYFAQMPHLKVLKIDHNPLEWPPKDITKFPSSVSLSGSMISEGESRSRSGSKVEDAEEMQRWLPNLLRYIRDNGDRRQRRSSPPPELPSDDERSNAEDRSIDLGQSRGLPRSISGGRLADSPRSSPGPLLNSSRIIRGGLSSRLDNKAASSDDQTVRQHTRNASHSTVASFEPDRRPSLKSKKSLPDLRQNHAAILAERRTGSANEDEGSSRATRRLRDDRPLGMMLVKASTPAGPGNGLSRSQGSRPVGVIAPRSASSVRASPSVASTLRTDFDSPSSTRAEAERSTNGLDRNSGAYFRRLSMLPASTISKAVPVTLLEFADAIRGILFSLSQVYTALRQFVVFASQDRLPAQLARLMGTADGSMSLLINALDRFDSLSRRGTPNPMIVRDIFVTCRDNVVTFGQLVAALGPQLKVLVATADVRYTRTLLLMLYGSMGEIANSWNAVAPLLEEMSVLNEDPSLATLILQPPTPSPTNISSPGVTSSRPGPAGVGSLYRARSKTRRHAGSFSVEDVQLGAVLPPAPFVTGTSSALSSPSEGPSTIVPPPTSQIPDYTFSNSNNGTIKARPAKTSRGAIPSPMALPSQPAYRDLVHNAFDLPNTPGGALSFLGDTAADPMASTPYGGFSLSSTLPVQPSSAPSRTDSFFLPRSEGLRAVSSSNADEIFLDMVDATAGMAFHVYGLLLDSFDENTDGQDDDGAGAMMRDLGSRRVKELTDMCILGNETATKLKGALGRVRGPDPQPGAALKFSSSDAKRLGDESYTFVQTVIRFAKLVKAISLEHGFAPRIREGVGELTIATREFAKHLHHTGFRPSNNATVSSTR